MTTRAAPAPAPSLPLSAAAAHIAHTAAAVHAPGVAAPHATEPAWPAGTMAPLPEPAMPPARDKALSPPPLLAAAAHGAHTAAAVQAPGVAAPHAAEPAWPAGTMVPLPEPAMPPATEEALTAAPLDPAAPPEAASCAVAAPARAPQHIASDAPAAPAIPPKPSSSPCIELDPPSLPGPTPDDTSLVDGSTLSGGWWVAWRVDVGRGKWCRRGSGGLVVGRRFDHEVVSLTPACPPCLPAGLPASQSPTMPPACPPCSPMLLACLTIPPRHLPRLAPPRPIAAGDSSLSRGMLPGDGASKSVLGELSGAQLLLQLLINGVHGVQHMEWPVSVLTCMPCCSSHAAACCMVQGGAASMLFQAPPHCHRAPFRCSGRPPACSGTARAAPRARFAWLRARYAGLGQGCVCKINSLLCLSAWLTTNGICPLIFVTTPRASLSSLPACSRAHPYTSQRCLPQPWSVVLACVQMWRALQC